MASQSIANFKDLLNQHEAADSMEGLSFREMELAQAQRRHILRNVYGLTHSATLSDRNSLQGMMDKAVVCDTVTISISGPNPSATRTSSSPAATGMPRPTKIVHDPRDPVFDARVDMRAFMMQSNTDVTSALSACGAWISLPRDKFLRIAQRADHDLNRPLRCLCRNLAWFDEVLAIGRKDWKLIDLADD